nr:MAG TPA: hypothetical protein [Caudoviricetes sp.]
MHMQLLYYILNLKRIIHIYLEYPPLYSFL